LLYLSPLPVIDNAAYEFYHLAPRGVRLVMIPVGLREFSADDLDRVLAPLDEEVRLVVQRGVDLMVLAGVPVALLAGVDGLSRVLARIETTAGVPALSTLDCVIGALRHLAVRKVAVANKWTDGMNATLGAFLARNGIDAVGGATRSLSPAEFSAMDARSSIDLAYRLGREALRSHPEADALYIGGGAWLAVPTIPVLEEEFGRPVVTNQAALAWSVLHRLNRWQPVPGLGVLLAGS
jgi:maleate cis-trans isomerase